MSTRSYLTFVLSFLSLQDELHLDQVDDALELAGLAGRQAQMAGMTPSFSFICSMQSKKSAPMRSSLLM